MSQSSSKPKRDRSRRTPRHHHGTFIGMLNELRSIAVATERADKKKEIATATAIESEHRRDLHYFANREDRNGNGE